MARGAINVGLLQHPPVDEWGLASLHGVLVKQWSATEASVALSSGEREHCSLVRAAPVGLGAQALARDRGWKYPAVLHTDSPAARVVASRSVVGRTRYMERTMSVGARDTQEWGAFISRRPRAQRARRTF